MAKAAAGATRSVSGAKKQGGNPQPKVVGQVRNPKAATRKNAATSSKGAKSPSCNPLASGRIAELLKRLDKTYPNPKCALTHRNAWELLVATILSAQCTDVRVNMVTPGLFAKYPTPQRFATLKPEELEPEIRSTGFYRNKAKSLVGAAQKLVAQYNGKVPDDMDRLLTLPGVARKTANVVLGSWFGRAAGVVVDTHVGRIAHRLELTSNADPSKIELDLMRVVPRKKWIDFSHQLIWHGRKLCSARKPNCAECPLEDICHAADKTWSSVETHKSAKL